MNAQDAIAQELQKFCIAKLNACWLTPWDREKGTTQINLVQEGRRYKAGGSLRSMAARA